MEIVLTCLAGFLLDCVFGDPGWLPHPVRFIGGLISFEEKFLRKVFPATKGGEIFAGGILAISVPAVSFCLCWLILLGAAMIHIWLKYALEVLFCYQIFAARSLRDESVRVYDHIERKDLAGARKYLSWIVGRDTENLDFRQITKAVVETIAENTSDGVIAPMAFMFIGGAPLGFLYKGVNTLDSMVGYKNDKYLYLGRVSAISDDVFNYIPARLTALALVAASVFTGFDARKAWKVYCRDRRNHASPNSAHPESACAGALHIQLAGDAYYFGKLYKKKTIGDDDRPVEADDILRTAKLMYGAAILCLIVFSGIRICLELL